MNEGSKPAVPFGALAQLQGMDADDLLESAKVGIKLMREIQAKAWSEGYHHGRLGKQDENAVNPYKGGAA